jgi:drug/metabolite transporter (DMT)-like permease
MTMTMGLRRVKAAPAASMTYLSGVWGIIAGLLVFGEVLHRTA